MRYIIATYLFVASLSLFAADESTTETVTPIPIVKLDRKTSILFDKDIKPIFVKKCLVCHSGGVTEGDLDLSSHRSLLRGGASGPAIKPGNSGESALVKLAGRADEPFMPPPEEKKLPPLTPDELALIKLWIDQGATPPTTSQPLVKLTKLSPAVQLVRAIAIAPDKSIVVAGHANQIQVYDATTGDDRGALVDPNVSGPDNKPVAAAHPSIVESLAFSPDSKLLASGSLQQATIWDPEKRAVAWKLTGFVHRVVTLHFSPDGKYLATGGGAPTIEGEVKVFDVESGELVLQIEQGHSDSVFGVRFSPDGNRLASCSADQSIKIFEFPSGKIIKKLEGHTHHVLDIAWQADGKLLASAGADKKVRLWDVETGEQLTKINRGGGAISTVFLDHNQQVNRLMFVGDTTQILTSSGNQPAQLWELSKEMRPGNYAKPYIQGRTLRSFGERGDYLYAIEISSDGSLVAAGSQSGIVRLYNGLDGKLVKSLPPPKPPKSQ